MAESIAHLKIEDQIQIIYDAYPRRRDIGAARKAIKRALADKEIPGPAAKRADTLLRAVHRYNEFVVLKRVERDYIPYPATWFNRKSYLNGMGM